MKVWENSKKLWKLGARRHARVRFSFVPVSCLEANLEAWFHSLVAKPTTASVCSGLLWNVFCCFQLWIFRLFNHKAKCLSVAWQRRDPQRRIHSIIYDLCPPEEQKSETQTKTSSYEVDERPSGNKLKLARVLYLT